MGQENHEYGTGSWLWIRIIDKAEGTVEDIRTFDREDVISDSVSQTVDEIREELPEEHVDKLFEGVEPKLREIEKESPEVDVLRRDFLKIGTGFAVSLGIVGSSKGALKSTHDSLNSLPKAYFENFWPNTLLEYATDRNIDQGLDRATSIVNETKTEWDQFVTQSTEMLSEEAMEGNSKGRDIHISGFYFRGYDFNFFRKIKNVAGEAHSVNFYFVSPEKVDIETAKNKDINKDSPVELHMDREVIAYRFLVNHPLLRHLFKSGRDDEVSWQSVALVNDKALNRIRALMHSLRALQFAMYFTHQYNVNFYPIYNPKEVPLRARIILEQDGSPVKASFVRLDKGIVGTSNPSKGHIVTEDYSEFIEHLDDERKQIQGRSKPYSIPEMENIYKDVYQRIHSLLDKEDDEGRIPSRKIACIRDILKGFELSETWEKNRNAVFPDWYCFYEQSLLLPITGERDDDSPCQDSQITSSVSGILEEELPPFHESDSDIELPILDIMPNRIYSEILCKQGFSDECKEDTET